MSGQMLNYNKRYENSLKKTQPPIMPSQLPKVKMDLAGLSRYAKNKGVNISNLAEDEIRRFIPTYNSFKA